MFGTRNTCVTDFSLSRNIQRGSGALPASCRIYVGHFPPRVKRPGHEASHSPPSSAEFKSDAVSSLPQHPFMACIGTNLPES